MNQIPAGRGYSIGSGTATMTISNQQTSDPQTMLRHTVNRLASNNGLLSKSICDLRDTVDRLIGTQPQDAKNGGTAPQAVPNGDMQAVHAEIDGYEAMLTLLACEINRLRSL